MYSYILIVLKIRIKYLIKINCCSHSTPYSVTLPSPAPPPPPPLHLYTTLCQLISQLVSRP